ncbi:DUF2726 domain-containing protein [Paraburkholderia fungorum]|uniref:DUF2726 domain-containing protein n=1 Tax=Paraburkholderia fungorum TaxID=134537 RepID=A0AAW3V4J6_9BURK|nr:DUF2726 domain-containing protein [Paraburkholderia fungorum]MBB6204310.1 hypothetical protein [Paraburkholderia fungorum]
MEGTRPQEGQATRTPVGNGTNMHTSLLATIVIVVVLLIVAASLSKRLQSKRGQINPKDFQRQAIMTATELKFFRQLVAILPDVWIFPQVAFAAVLKPSARGKEYWRAFGQIAQKRLDFVLYAHDMTLLAVVELDDATHDRKADADRQRDALFHHAGIRTLRFDVRRWPGEDEILTAVYPVAQAPSGQKRRRWLADRIGV